MAYRCVTGWLQGKQKAFLVLLEYHRNNLGRVVDEREKAEEDGNESHYSCTCLEPEEGRDMNLCQNLEHVGVCPQGGCRLLQPGNGQPISDSQRVLVAPLVDSLRLDSREAVKRPEWLRKRKEETVVSHSNHSGDSGLRLKSPSRELTIP